MKKSRHLLLAGAALLIVADAALGFVWGERWWSTAELDDADARIQRVPMAFGDWKGEKLPDFSRPALERAGFHGYTLRSYENQRTQARVTVMLACGRPGPLAVHTPEVCYNATGFVQAGDVGRWAPDGLPNAPAFFKTTFARKEANAPEHLRVLWAWNKNGAWRISDNPRWTFAGGPVLYKMYVTQSYAPRNKETDGDDCQEFLADFLPELDKVLAPHP
jgi:hypothetical protein